MRAPPILAILIGAIWLAFTSIPASAQTPQSPLTNAASPYLRLHAGDLVRWRQWDEATIALAKSINRPLMVSFGYTACHWCHVMQRLHFNNPTIAKFINENFVAVMVDRERRPALDETFMLVTETLTQRGGWPNTVFLTPEKKPIYGTAYVPPEPFTEILTVVADEWRNNRAAVEKEAENLSALIGNFMARSEKAANITPQIIADAASALAAQFDEFNGGFGDAPKFFRQPVLMFLLQHYEKTGDTKALEAVETTLKAVASGGIHDLLEGGFHRYAVDPGWRVPHFEKMLYDQAQMAMVYVNAYRLTGNAAYANVARKTLDYVLADLTAPQGGFYATRDADSLDTKGEEEEGAYYVWSPNELVAILGEKDADFAIENFDVMGDGDFAGKVILNLDQIGRSPSQRVVGILSRLGKIRSKRSKPRRDEKIVLNWNALTISAMARASTVLGDDQYGEAALRAGAFLWEHLRPQSGVLRRSIFKGVAEVDAVLEDYALLAAGFVDLYDLSNDQSWLDRAVALVREMDAKFGDADAGDYFATADLSGFVRSKQRSDADLPASNAVALDVLTRLNRRFDDPQWTRKAEALLAAISGFIVDNPLGGAASLAVADRHLNGPVGALQYSSLGRVKATANLAADGRKLNLHLQIADGWHVNAHKPLEDNFIPTSLSVGSGDAAIDYPAPLVKKLGFNDQEMAVHEHQMKITATLPNRAGSTKATLQIQACSDSICLLPETLVFIVAPIPPRAD